MVNLRSVHNEMNFLLCLSGILGLEVTNAPGMADLLGSNLTVPVFFQRGNSQFQKNSRLIIICIFCRLNCHIVELF